MRHIRTLAQLVRYYHRLWRYDTRQHVPRDPRDAELRLRGERLQKRARDIRLARTKTETGGARLP